VTDIQATGIQAALDQLLDEFSDKDIAEMLEQFLVNNHTLKSAYGLEDEHLEAVYAIAYGKYNSGKYEDSHSLFQFLCQLDHMERKYWMGLGAARQMLGRYEGAVDAYGMAAQFGIEEPEPPMRAAECHLALGDREAARSGFQYVVDCAGEGAEHQALKRRAQGRLAMLAAAGEEASS